MVIQKSVLVLCCVVVLGLAGCSRQQSDWEKARAANSAEAYEQFLKSYPNGEFTAQAQARLKELYEERDWQKARDADTPEAYQAFLKQYPEGKWTEEARIRVENFTLAQAPSGASSANTANAPSAAAYPQGTPPAASAAPANASPTTSAVRTPTVPPGATGAYGIQLGAFKSSDTADRRWARLQKKYPPVLAGLTHKVVQTKSSKGTVYRLQAFGVTEKHARSLCSKLKAESQACIVVKPPRH
jgi:cell division septation protein DedD